MARTVVVKKRTGAQWHSANPETGVWRKLCSGTNESAKTKPVGYTARNFYPLRNPAFEVVA